jgi:hypothetical protein
MILGWRCLIKNNASDVTAKILRLYIRGVKGKVPLVRRDLSFKWIMLFYLIVVPTRPRLLSRLI